MHNLIAIEELKQWIDELDYHQHTEEYMHDLENFTQFQKQYDTIRNVSKTVFSHFLIIAFMNLVGLVLTNWLVSTNRSMTFLMINGVA